jgi:CheY-like chemotaxis protein
MDSTRQLRGVLDLTNACSALDRPDRVLEAALPVLLELGGCDAAVVLAAPSSPWRSHAVGMELDTPPDLAEPPDAAVLVDATVPDRWVGQGVTRAVVRHLPHDLGRLVLAWRSSGPDDLVGLELATAVVDQHLRRTLATAQERQGARGAEERRRALDINDNVVQGLVAASYALDQGEVDRATGFLAHTLDAARAMMDDMLEPTHGQGFQPGDLVRAAPATIGAPRPPVVPTSQAPTTHTVLVVDDADDLRMLLRARMEARHGLTVVGEAADGLAAVELASQLQPDLVMLDLAMPRMDGLEALPLIRAAVPGVRVIVLSGFNQSTLAEKAMEAGADRYVVKGGSMRQLLDLVDTVLADAS